MSARAAGKAADTDGRETDSGIEVKPVYTEEDVAGLELELPGEFPFTRGPYADMYRGRPWTIRQYAGFASAEETNARFRYLLERGSTGSPWPSTCPRSSATTPTTSGQSAKLAAQASRSTRSRTWSFSSTRSRSAKFQPR